MTQWLLYFIPVRGFVLSVVERCAETYSEETSNSFSVKRWYLLVFLMQV